MRGLFLGYVVDPEMDKVETYLPFIAKDENGAKIKLAQMLGDRLDKDIEDYDILVMRIGNVRDKKEVREVKVISD